MEKPSKEYLTRLYLKENKSLKDLAFLFNVKRQTVQYWLFKYKIVKQKKTNKPSREDLFYRYVYLNKSIKELKAYYGVCKNTLEKWLTDYKIKKGKEKTFICLQRILQEKYGVSNSFKIKGVPEKIIQTNLKKYGCKKYSQTKEYKVKTRNTNLARYNCEFPNQNEKVKKKIKNTCLKRYYSTSYIISKEYKNKLFEEHQVFNINQTHIPKEVLGILQDKNKLSDIINLLHSKTFKTVGSALGINETTVAKYIRRYNLDHLINFCSSSLEQEIKDILKDIPLKKDRKILDGKEIDLYSAEHKIGIEFNGDYWHSDAKKSKDYHYNKSKLAESKGVFIYHIFEHEWNDLRKKQIIIDQLKDLFGYSRKVIKAEDCIIQEVPTKDKNTFLKDSHLQGKDKNTISLGLYCAGVLVSVMTFTRINKQCFCYGLSRFCCKLGYSVTNGFERLFNYFKEQYKPIKIVTYSDVAKNSGNIFKIHGFNLKSIMKPPCCWTNKSNKIYDCGRKVWEWGA